MGRVVARCICCSEGLTITVRGRGRPRRQLHEEVRRERREREERETQTSESGVEDALEVVWKEPVAKKLTLSYREFFDANLR